MATITTFQNLSERLKVVRNVTAQATTGQEDFIQVPPGATYLYVDFNMTAMAGTSPSTTVNVRHGNLVTRDDTTGMVGYHQAFAPSTALTGAARLLFNIGPGVTGITNDSTNAATGTSQLVVNALLLPWIGFRVVNSRTNANETYTYTVAVAFR